MGNLWPYTRLHTYKRWVIYGVSPASILEKYDHVIITKHCLCWRGWQQAISFFDMNRFMFTQPSHFHYTDIIMSTIVSQITSLMIVYSTVYSGTDKRQHQSSMSLAFVREIHQWQVNSLPKWPVTRKMFPFDDIIMVYHTIPGCCLYSSCVIGMQVGVILPAPCTDTNCFISWSEYIIPPQQITPLTINGSKLLEEWPGAGHQCGCWCPGDKAPGHLHSQYCLNSYGTQFASENNKANLRDLI